jgi:glyoxylase-like metal-dependent hydrolase (beta-lactamase superfamily II)
VRIHTLPAGPIATNGYLLVDETRHEALLVDAPHDVWAVVEPILTKTRSKVAALLITHGHWDHTGDAARVQALGVPLYAHEADRILIERPEVMGNFSLPGVTFTPARIDHQVEQGTVLHLAGQRIEVRHVPGHCPGNVLYYFPALGAAFVGDALFAGGIGRFDLPGGNFEQLEHSIRTQIYSLPANTTVYAGHGPATTVGEEMMNNPYVSA